MRVFIAIVLLAYGIGSISFSVIFSRKLAGFDVREKGSKNAGTTNVLRTVGKKAALLTLICDILKGVIAVLIARYVGRWLLIEDTKTLEYLAALMVIIGHTFPIFFEFRGGKGVATSLGALLVLDWKIGLTCLVFAIVLMAITKMVSVGSILAAVLFPILTIFMTDANFKSVIVSVLIALLVIFNHRTNIKRIREGKENKLSFNK